MITPVSQRWTGRCARFVPPSTVFEPRHYEVVLLTSLDEARTFVRRHHYSGSLPAVRYAFGLYQGEHLVGVAIFSHPVNEGTLAVIPGERMERAELGRLVLLDSVPFNAESWFIARCFGRLREEGLVGVVSFSDPVPRTRVDGSIVFAGHVGQIYQATNAVYLGQSKAERRLLLPDGTTLHNRALAKIRAYDRGWRYAAALLERHGAEPLTEGDDSRAWLARWIPKITRPFLHSGNHKYAFALDRRVRKHLPPSRPYPKLALQEAA
jgi:hypothetical protein